MRREIEEICRKAGKAILSHYPPVEVNEKGDGSPVTKADLEAHEIILDGLSIFHSIPVVSEEDFDSKVYPPADRFWLVDPLDGTKDFIHKTGDFTVNIALIEFGKPIAGFIYVPSRDLMFSAYEGKCHKNGKLLENTLPNSKVVAATSHFHKSCEVIDYLSRKGITSFSSVGSSYKFCLLAEGIIDIYPRFSPTSHWDIAAGHAIIEATGCVITTWDRKPISYQNLPIINPDFIACKASLYEALVSR